MSTIIRAKQSHEAKVEALREQHERLAAVQGKPGPRHNTYMKTRRAQHDATKKR